jgi:hypothetical protein
MYHWFIIVLESGVSKYKKTIQTPISTSTFFDSKRKHHESRSSGPFQANGFISPHFPTSSTIPSLHFKPSYISAERKMPTANHAVSTSSADLGSHSTITRVPHSTNHAVHEISDEEETPTSSKPERPKTSYGRRKIDAPKQPVPLDFQPVMVSKSKKFEFSDSRQTKIDQMKRRDPNTFKFTYLWCNEANQESGKFIMDSNGIDIETEKGSKLFILKSDLRLLSYSPDFTGNGFYLKVEVSDNRVYDFAIRSSYSDFKKAMNETMAFSNISHMQDCVIAHFVNKVETANPNHSLQREILTRSKRTFVPPSVKKIEHVNLVGDEHEEEKTYPRKSARLSSNSPPLTNNECHLTNVGYSNILQTLNFLFR